MSLTKELAKVPAAKEKSEPLLFKVRKCIKRHSMYGDFFASSDRNALENNRTKHQQAEWFSRLSTESRIKILIPYFGDITSDDI